jgi:hypothetical protein
LPSTTGHWNNQQPKPKKPALSRVSISTYTI